MFPVVVGNLVSLSGFAEESCFGLSPPKWKLEQEGFLKPKARLME